jgi:hypothetical protein
MAELADAHGLGPCAERRAGSSPVPGTILCQPIDVEDWSKAIACSSHFLCTARTIYSLFERFWRTPIVGAGAQAKIVLAQRTNGFRYAILLVLQASNPECEVGVD